jgi:hypothetical protein
MTVLPIDRPAIGVDGSALVVEFHEISVLECDGVDFVGGCDFIRHGHFAHGAAAEIEDVSG